MSASKSKEERLDCYIPVTESGCWLWLGSIDGAGYPRYYSGAGVMQRSLSATRLFFEHFNGLVPDGMLLCHRCDVPSCVNPSHLFLGTHKENSDDMFAKGRNKNTRTKLSKIERLFIKSSIEGTSILAERFGVTRRNVRHLRQTAA